jgi:actin-related protein 5
MMLAFMFWRLGIKEDTIPHPIVMTEAVCNPEFSRTHIAELLFEHYGVRTFMTSLRVTWGT